MHNIVGYEERSRYSGSVRAGRLGARTRVGKRYLTPTQTGPGFHMASCTESTRSLCEGKWPGRGVDHPPLSTVFHGTLEGRHFYFCITRLPILTIQINYLAT